MLLQDETRGAIHWDGSIFIADLFFKKIYVSLNYGGRVLHGTAYILLPYHIRANVS